MKTHVITALLVALSLNLAAQHPNLDTIRAYYNSVSSLELAEQIYCNNLKYLVESTVEGIGTMPLERYSSEVKMLAEVILVQEKDMQKLRDGGCVIFLEPRFKDAKNFNFSRNIYDFITFDSTRTEAMYFNDRNGEVVFLRGSDPSVHNYVLAEEGATKTKRFFSLIKEENLDALLNDGMMLGEKTVDLNGRILGYNRNYLFLKGDKIFVYRTIDGEKYELNEFVRKFFTEEEMKRRAILSERGVIEYR